MIQAVVDDALTEASRGLVGRCPQCHAPVRPKVGRIVRAHWAHHATVDCDPWSEPESAWHLWWKSLVPADRREVILGNHRADLVDLDGAVVELQHSSISVDELRARERHYRRMVWLLDGTAWNDARFEVRPDDGYDRFRWRWCTRWALRAACPVLIDLGDVRGVFWIKRLHGAERAAGWGHLYDRQQIVDVIQRGGFLR